mgnify:CR=1 FL=1
MPIAPYHISHLILSIIKKRTSIMEKGNTEKNPSKASNLSESTFAEGNLFGDSEMQKLAEEAKDAKVRAYQSNSLHAKFLQQ